MTDKFLKTDDLAELIASITEGGGRFVAPVTDARQVVYAEVKSAWDIVSDYILPRNSFKEWLFPQTEVIARYEILKDGVDLKGEEVAKTRTVVFGARPCEAASLASLRSVFTWGSVDEAYTMREDNTTVLTVACTKADDECFCTTVNLSPTSTEGTDVALFEADGGYIARAITDKGKELLKDKVFETKSKGAKEHKLADPEKISGVDLKKLSARLANTENYEEPEWADLTRKCCGCGACTFACPTCHCFDITDEGTAFEGERRKNWDACQFDHFTLHASGHNPRDTQYKRYRNRFMCKFHIYPTKFNSTGCVGCGRCIRVCPVRLDITEVMEALSK
jgi:ferredoxin